MDKLIIEILIKWRQDLFDFLFSQRSINGWNVHWYLDFNSFIALQAVPLFALYSESKRELQTRYADARVKGKTKTKRERNSCDAFKVPNRPSTQIQNENTQRLWSCHSHWSNTVIDLFINYNWLSFAGFIAVLLSSPCVTLHWTSVKSSDLHSSRSYVNEAEMQGGLHKRQLRDWHSKLYLSELIWIVPLGGLVVKS